MRAKGLIVLVRRFADALRDLAPIILVIAFFQVVVIQQPFPNLAGVTLGLVCVVAGLALFIQGLEQGLFPLGEAIAHAFVNKGSVVALLAFAFCLGFGTTVAEPALFAVGDKAAEVARWLVTRKVSMVGGDSCCVQIMPPVSSDNVHHILFFQEGIPLLENMELKDVAREQAYEFLFLNLTLRIKGATGSPTRPVAVL